MIALRCLLAGHDDSLDRHTLRVRCERCGRTSPGLDLSDLPKPRKIHEEPDGRERMVRRGLRRVVAVGGRQ